MNRRYSIAVALAVACASSAQNTDRGSGTPTFGSTTRLVQVNVVAHDKNGRPVPDLHKEDFDLFENGRRQQMAVFVTEQGKPAARPALPPNEFSNQFAATNPARAGYTLILLDWLNSSMYSRITSQQEVLKLLKQVDVHDLVAVCVLDRGLRVLHDFTDDRAELVRRIAAASVALSEGPPEDLRAVSNADGIDLSPVELALSGMTRYLAARRVLDTLSAFEQIAAYLGSVPGRKSMIWLTAGFPSAMGYDRPQPPELDIRGTPPRPEGVGGEATDVGEWERRVRTERRTFSAEMERAFRRLNDADIAVYPIDARGLLAGPSGYINIAAMKEIADRTGGRAYYNRNDLDTAIRSAIDDAQASYTLGYYPAENRADGKFRAIHVRARRPGIELRYRRGYVAEGNTEQKTASRIELERVVGSPLDATLIPVNASASKSGEKLAVRVSIDPSALTLRENHGWRKGKISIFFAFRPGDASGRLQLETLTRDLDLPREMYPQLLQRGLSFRKEIPIAPKATSLRIVVRDDQSSSMGSVTIPLSAVQ